MRKKTRKTALQLSKGHLVPGVDESGSQWLVVKERSLYDLRPWRVYLWPYVSVVPVDNLFIRGPFTHHDALMMMARLNHEHESALLVMRRFEET